MVTITDGWRKDSTVVGGFFRGMSTTRGGVAEMVEGAPAGGGIGGEPASDWVKEFVSPILEDLRGGCGGPDVAEWARANQEQLLEQLVNYWTKYWELVTPILQGVGLENHPTFYCTGIMVSWCWFVDWQPLIDAYRMETLDGLTDISTGGIEALTHFLNLVPEGGDLRMVVNCGWDFAGTLVHAAGGEADYNLALDLYRAHPLGGREAIINSVPRPPQPDRALVAHYLAEDGGELGSFVRGVTTAIAEGVRPAMGLRRTGWCVMMVSLGVVVWW